MTTRKTEPYGFVRGFRKPSTPSVRTHARDFKADRVFSSTPPNSRRVAYTRRGGGLPRLNEFIALVTPCDFAGYCPRARTPRQTISHKNNVRHTIATSARACRVRAYTTDAVFRKRFVTRIETIANYGDGQRTGRSRALCTPLTPVRRVYCFRENAEGQNAAVIVDAVVASFARRGSERCVSLYRRIGGGA